MDNKKIRNSNCQQINKKNSYCKKFLSLLGINPRKSSLEKKVTDVIEEQEEYGYLMSVQERIMLYNLLSIGNITLGDIMVKRSDISAIEENTKLSELKNLIIRTGHTRILIYSETLDKIKGFIHAKDLLDYNNDKNDNYASIIRKVMFVPISMRAIDLLDQMKVNGSSHIAVIVDEYGGTEGIITMEDLVEEIIGDIKDEYDSNEVIKEEFGIIKRGANIFEVSGRLLLSELTKKINIYFFNPEQENSEFSTIGGLVVYLSDSIPKKGTVLEYSNLELTILDSDGRRVKRILLRIKQEA